MQPADVGDGVATKLFPFHLVKGVLFDLLLKEINVRLAPADTAEKAALERAKEGLPHRLALINAQIDVADPSDVARKFLAVVCSLWQLLRIHPSIALIEPSFLASSLWMEAFTTVFQSSCKAAETSTLRLSEGCAVVQSALSGLGHGEEPFSSLDAPRIAHLVALIRWWSDDICSDRWGVKDLWGSCVVDGARRMPLDIIARDGLAALVPLAVEKGCSVNGDFSGTSMFSPAAAAFHGGHFDVFEALMAHGLDLSRPYEEDGLPLSFALFVMGNGKSAFLSRLLLARPDATLASASPIKGRRLVNLLGAAVVSKDAALVDLALSSGAEVEYRFKQDRETADVYPTIMLAMETRCAPVLEVLVKKGKVWDGWRERYEADARAAILHFLTGLAISAYPSNPLYNGNRGDLFEYNSHAAECLETVLSTGFVCKREPAEGNYILGALYPLKTDLLDLRCVLQDQHALLVLKRFHRAGFDVVRIPEDPLGLRHIAVFCNQPLVLDWYLTDVGAPDEADMREDRERYNTGLITTAFRAGSIDCAMLLLEKYKVRAAYPEGTWLDQPVISFFSRMDELSDAATERVLAAMVERSPSLFDVPCFREAALAASEAEVTIERQSTGSSDFTPWNPLFILTFCGKPRTLEFLLTKNLPGVAAMANRPVLRSSGLSTAVQAAALGKHWDCLSIILRYTDARVTDTYDGTLSAFELIRRAIGTSSGPPRPLVAVVEARAKKELEEEAAKAKTAAASQAAGAATNAFEDPSVKPLTEAEEKKKAKKKAAKKKAKAKKKAAANAGAGGAASGAKEPESDDSSGDDDEGPHEEEPDDNLIDSRNAPSLDLMLEQIGLKEKK